MHLLCKLVAVLGILTVAHSWNDLDEDGNVFDEEYHIASGRYPGSRRLIWRYNEYAAKPFQEEKESSTQIKQHPDLLQKVYKPLDEVGDSCKFPEYLSCPYTRFNIWGNDNTRKSGRYCKCKHFVKVPINKYTGTYDTPLCNQDEELSCKNHYGPSNQRSINGPSTGRYCRCLTRKEQNDYYEGYRWRFPGNCCTFYVKPNILLNQARGRLCYTRLREVCGEDLPKNLFHPKWKFLLDEQKRRKDENMNYHFPIYSRFSLSECMHQKRNPMRGYGAREHYERYGDIIHECRDVGVRDGSLDCPVEVCGESSDFVNLGIKKENGPYLIAYDPSATVEDVSINEIEQTRKDFLAV